MKLPSVGAAVVHEGDALQVMRELPSASFDLVLTDPPYSSGARREAEKGRAYSMKQYVKDDDWIAGDSLTAKGFAYLMRECALEWHRILRQGGHVLAFIDWRMMTHLAPAVESADLRHINVLTWDKTYPGMGSCFRYQHELVLHFCKGDPRPPRRRDVGNVLRHKPVRNGDHPTEKPAGLLRELVGVVGHPGGLMLDPFAGSGSGLAAAVADGMGAVGIERDPKYAAIARARAARATRQDTLEAAVQEALPNPSLSAGGGDA